MLLYLLQTCSGSKVTESNDRRVREQVGAKLEALQWKVPCSRACRHCKLPCGQAHVHEGACDCGTDHQCHCANAHGQCDLPAGHGAAHNLPAPPPPPPPHSSSRIAVSLTSLPSLQSPLSSSGRQRRPSFHSKLTVDELRNSWIGTCKDSACAICYEPLDTSSIEELYCKHAFHPACIGSWAREKRSCPMCRFPVDVSSLSGDAQTLTNRAAQGAQAPRPSSRQVAPSSSLPAVQGNIDAIATPSWVVNATRRPRVFRGNDGQTRSGSSNGQVQRVQPIRRSRSRV